MSGAAYLDIVSGARRGPLAAMARAFLSVLALFYRLAVALRNAAFDLGLRRASRVACPVFSVGNLTAGGTGKTPLVEYLGRALLARGKKVAILSRGYRGRGAPLGRNDEALLLAENLPEAAQIQDPDRVRGARAALASGADCILLDDGFQHRRIARDLDVVLVDATNPWGYGRLLPRGLLREPRAALARARIVAITRADLVSGERLAALRAEIEARAPRATIAEVVEEPLALARIGPTSEPPLEPAWLAGRTVFAFSGIGNPAAFHARLERLGARVCGRRSFPDHHAYAEEDLLRVVEAARGAGAEAIVCTQKDAVKIAGADRSPTHCAATGTPPTPSRGEGASHGELDSRRKPSPIGGACSGRGSLPRSHDLPLLYLKIRASIRAGEDAIEKALTDLLPP